jgi:hypothetical protein
MDSFNKFYVDLSKTRISHLTCQTFELRREETTGDRLINFARDLLCLLCDIYTIASRYCQWIVVHIKNVIQTVMMTTSYRIFNYTTYLLKIHASCCEKGCSMQATKYTERGFIRNLFQKFLEIPVMISTN